ncbi:hypothetical protein CPC08DRAFT_606705, partial [Agrocybe pediades]
TQNARKETKFFNEGRASILEGVDDFLPTMSVFSGPQSKHVFLALVYGYFLTWRYGVTVAKSITLKEKFENLVLSSRLSLMLLNTNETAGDSTATAKGVKNAIVEFLSANTKTTATITAETVQVATTVSANGDTHVGNLVAQAMQKVGNEG